MTEYNANHGTPDDVFPADPMFMGLVSGGPDSNVILAKLTNIFQSRSEEVFRVWDHTCQHGYYME